MSQRVTLIGNEPADLATWQRVRFGDWTHMAWDEPGQERLLGKIDGPILSALDGSRFTSKDVTPST